MSTSAAEQIAARLLEVAPTERRAAALALLGDGGVSREEALALRYHWPMWARTEQHAPDGDWITWCYLAGRGAGKTRTGAEWVRHRLENGSRRLLFIGGTAGDIRDVMVEGESGIMAVLPPAKRPRYEPSKRLITFHTGAIANLRAAEKPDSLRGPQYDTVWGDEGAAWRYGTEAWDNAMLGLRLGRDPKAFMSTTPKPKKLIRTLVGDPTCMVTRGSTYDNLANLAAPFIYKIVSKYEGTRLGRQEIYAELLEEVPGALWRRRQLDDRRVAAVPCALVRVVIGVDPPGSEPDEQDEDSGPMTECGIVIAGLGEDGNVYVLQDRSRRASPAEWAAEVIAAFHHWEADLVVAETNFGGPMVLNTIAAVDARVPVEGVHAKKGKRLRAEPVSALFEANKAYPPRCYLLGAHDELEDQMCNWVPGEDSPDRLDAMVYAVTELVFPEGTSDEIVEYDDRVQISRY